MKNKFLIILNLLLFVASSNIFSYDHWFKNWTTRPLKVQANFSGCDNQGAVLKGAHYRDANGKIQSPGRQIPGAEEDLGKGGCGVNFIRVSGQFANSPYERSYSPKTWPATWIFTESEEYDDATGLPYLNVEVR